MADRPILFSGAMIRALMDGRKTMTRRVLKPQPNCLNGGLPLNDGRGSYSIEGGWKRYPIARGDRLWVREAHYLTDDGDQEYAVYAADDEAVRDHNKQMEALAGRIPEEVWRRHVKLRPSIHMPRWASRLTLTVTDVRVQRLQDISGNDAQAEGISIGGPDVEVYRREADRNHEAARRWNAYRIRQYRDVWEQINGAGSWDANPWVAVYGFTVEHRNIESEARHDL